MLNKILIANRGEIACRIVHTCRRLGVGTVAVYSEADRGARHVRLADEAVHIGPAAAAESYLAAERILDAARAAGADAVHPGYGFLSESADFARRCAEADLVFVGPGPATLEKMGSKREAKRIMEEARVPTVPGYHGADQGLATLAREAARIGYPVLVKASAGGGGKGMRIVNEAGALEEAVASARREAKSAFGDDTLLLERYLLRPRHIEVQVCADSHGNVVHLYERECSIQRRYQKIIEETPSPFLDDELRTQILAAGVAAAQAVDYVNAGTVEFIVDAGRQFHFMEMNTRLQVEHPVTEMVTGVDLVEWQLRVAAGERLPGQADIRSRGHAIEARLYAERPREGFLPSTGRVEAFVHPVTSEDFRLDTGIEDGDDITVHYDPMVAKLICGGADRDQAIANLRRVLAGTTVFGPETNIGLLRQIAGHDQFAAGEIDTGYIDMHLDELLARQPEPPAPALAAAAARHMLDRQYLMSLNGAAPHSPWQIADGWQANGRTRNRIALRQATGDAIEVSIVGWDGRYTATAAGTTVDVVAGSGNGGTAMRVREGDGAALDYVVHRCADAYLVARADEGYELSETALYPIATAEDDEEAHPGSPMPGRIVALKVEPGRHVEKGQPLMVLEGMKMEFTVTARRAGVVARVLYDVGDLVEAEVPLVDIDTAEDAG